MLDNILYTCTCNYDVIYCARQCAHSDVFKQRTLFNSLNGNPMSRVQTVVNWGTTSSVAAGNKAQNGSIFSTLSSPHMQHFVATL